ncbi:MAG: hypothetical protein L0Z53_01995 [Acidobacteriales bacterium]|nr:hypothetical protein [Terriglobales bacterium]
MPRKPKPKPDDPAEYKRFLETAEGVEASDDPKAFERAFKRVVTPAKSRRAEP